MTMEHTHPPLPTGQAAGVLCLHPGPAKIETVFLLWAKPDIGFLLQCSRKCKRARHSDRDEPKGFLLLHGFSIAA